MAPVRERGLIKLLAPVPAFATVSEILARVPQRTGAALNS